MSQTQLRLTPTKNPDEVLMFIRGDGLLRKCAGGYDVDRDALKKWIAESKAVFLIASENGTRGLGFVMLNPEKNGAYSIHLCLRTVGEKSKRIVALAINYAKYVLGAIELDAVYPSKHKAVKRMAMNFGFRDDPNLVSFYKVPQDQPFSFQSLALA